MLAAHPDNPECSIEPGSCQIAIYGGGVPKLGLKEVEWPCADAAGTWIEAACRDGEENQAKVECERAKCAGGAKQREIARERRKRNPIASRERA
jgi:hypothetical protein